MGGDISKEEAESRFFDDYVLVRAEYDERFGEINIYKSKCSSDIMLVKEKIFENKSKFESYKKESEIRRKLDSTFVSQIHYFNSKPFAQILTLYSWCPRRMVHFIFQSHNRIRISRDDFGQIITANENLKRGLSSGTSLF